VPIGQPVEYRIPLIHNARRFLAGHRIQLMLTSDDQPKDIPALLDYRHPPVGTTSRNTIHASSRLLRPVLTAQQKS
jgi:predicted acyl esterase